MKSFIDAANNIIHADPLPRIDVSLFEQSPESGWEKKTQAVMVLAQRGASPSHAHKQCQALLNNPCAPLSMPHTGDKTFGMCSLRGVGLLSSAAPLPPALKIRRGSVVIATFLRLL